MKTFRTPEAAREAGWEVNVHVRLPGAARHVKGAFEYARILTPSEACALEVLEKVMWSGDAWCVMCGGLKEQGHSPDCRLASVLKELRGEGL